MQRHIDRTRHGCCRRHVRANSKFGPAKDLSASPVTPPAFRRAPLGMTTDARPGQATTAARASWKTRKHAVGDAVWLGTSRKSFARWCLSVKLAGAGGAGAIDPMQNMQCSCGGGCCLLLVSMKSSDSALSPTTCCWRVCSTSLYTFPLRLIQDVGSTLQAGTQGKVPARPGRMPSHSDAISLRQWTMVEQGCALPRTRTFPRTQGF